MIDREFSADLTGEWSNPLNPLNQVDRDALLPLLNGGETDAGAVGGAAAGYNWQMDRLLFGAEADFSVLDGGNSTTTNVTAISPYRVETFTGIDWVATLRGRIGAAFDRSLVYVTGGLALGEREFNRKIVQLNFPYVQTDASSSIEAGWALGAGIEHALNDRWSFRLQYLHIDLGSESSRSAGVCPPPDVAVCAVYTGSHEVDFALDRVTAGFSYRFGGP